MADSTTQQRRRRVFPAVLGGSGNLELREDGTRELREDATFEKRE